MADRRAMIFDIQRSSFVDGPGSRTAVFFKGCNLRCAWCHNPEGQSPLSEELFYAEKCRGCGLCRNAWESVCPNGARLPCGREYSVEELLVECVRDKLFFDASGGGVTFSGGECMLQMDFLCELLMRCKEQGLHTAVDTAGHVPYESFERNLPYTDLLLYDLKCMDPQRHEAYTGVDNSMILGNLERLLKKGCSVWVRIPLIPSVNGTEEEMAAMRAFFERCGAPGRIELLPYHDMGGSKYRALGKEAKTFSVPSPTDVKRLRSYLPDDGE